MIMIIRKCLQVTNDNWMIVKVLCLNSSSSKWLVAGGLPVGAKGG